MIAADPDAAIAFLADEVRAAVRDDGAQAVVLGGAALAGLAARIAPGQVPVIDRCVCRGAGTAGRVTAAGGARPPRSRADAQRWPR